MPVALHAERLVVALFFLACSCVGLSSAGFATTSAAFLGPRRQRRHPFSSNSMPRSSGSTPDAVADDHDRRPGSSAAAAPPVRIAYAGNSMIYFHDTPRFFSNLAGEEQVGAQDSCLRGGASLVSLLEKGNGMRRIFGTERALLESVEDGGGETRTYDIGAPTVRSLLSDQKWDFCVMNDYTQSPARVASRAETVSTLLADYAPLFLKSGASPVFIVTPAYREPINGSADLGSVAEFTARTVEGCEEYAAALGRVLPPGQRPRVAPVGVAYLHLHDTDRAMWEKLFHTDHFHPSPIGTYLQGCVLHWTLFGRGAPASTTKGSSQSSPDEDFGPRLWADARVMQPADEEELPLPTLAEAEYLREVAEEVCKRYLRLK